MNFPNDRGLGIIEVMIAVMVLMITMVGTISTYSYLTRQTSIMRQKRSSLRLAQKRLEECMADPLVFQKTFEPEPIIIENLPGTVEISIDPSEQRLECQITWENGNVSLATIWGE